MVDEYEFKVEFSFYTFVSEKRMTRQEKESSIHRVAISLTGGYMMEISGNLQVKVTEHHLQGVEVAKSPLARLKERYVTVSGGYLHVKDNEEEENKLLIVPLSTIIEMDYDNFDSTDFSFTCLEDDIESTYFFRNESSADLWVRHVVVEVLNAAQVVENSIAMLLKSEHNESVSPQK